MKNTSNAGHGPWRVIRHGKCPGAWNMAVDEAILRGVETGASPPTLRFYGWSPPAISLGYSQGTEDIDGEQCASLGVDIVRRPTGGKAVYHDREITYSLVLPLPSDIFPGSLEESSRLISRCLVDGLAALGPRMAVGIAGSIPGSVDRGRVACFEGPSAWEITAGGKKLVGNAQRRREKGALQHGAIPLEIRWDILRGLFPRGGLPVSPDAVGLGDALGRMPGEEEVIRGILNGFQSVLGVEFLEGPLGAEEAETAETLMKSVTLTLDSMGRIMNKRTCL